MLVYALVWPVLGLVLVFGLFTSLAIVGRKARRAALERQAQMTVEVAAAPRIDPFELSLKKQEEELLARRTRMQGELAPPARSVPLASPTRSPPFVSSVTMRPMQTVPKPILAPKPIPAVPAFAPAAAPSVAAPVPRPLPKPAPTIPIPTATGAPAPPRAFSYTPLPLLSRAAKSTPAPAPVVVPQPSPPAPAPARGQVPTVAPTVPETPGPAPAPVPPMIREAVSPPVPAFVEPIPVVADAIPSPQPRIQEVVAVVAVPTHHEPSPPLPITTAEVASVPVNVPAPSGLLTVDRMAIEQWRDVEVLAASSKTVIPRTAAKDAPLGRFEVRSVPRAKSLEIDWGEVEVRHDVKLA